MPPPCKVPKPRATVLDPAKGWIDAMLREDLSTPRKHRWAEELFEENTRLLANPLPPPDDVEDLDGWTLHRLRHSADPRRRGRRLNSHAARALPARFRPFAGAVRGPGVDAVARHVAERDPAASRRG
ncbi:hypothetical protein [Streptomyces sp. bgisy031]|uniref:hypothetical protein n=1 Tax=Streptomyces sp. bgisy031 TaxID=3413772 RepID=UPI003D71B416